MRLNKKEYEHGNIQKLLVKICFFFKSINLEIYLPSERSESVKLLVPKELDTGNMQIGSIQYGGVKYPLIDKSLTNLTYVEVRLKGDFLRKIDKYNEVYNLLQDKDANDWLKYKFTYSKEDIILAKRVATIISSGLEKKYGSEYLTFGIDKSILDLPRQTINSYVMYNQNEAVKIVSEILVEQGYNVSRLSQINPNYHILAEANGKTAKILVRHLQYDSAYKESTLPYQVYKIDAFENLEDQKAKLNDIDFVVGYNFKDKAFACLTIEDFIEKRSRVVHEKEGLRSEFYNSWIELKNYFNK